LDLDALHPIDDIGMNSISTIFEPTSLLQIIYLTLAANGVVDNAS
jgi:hypothetical protein